MVKYETWEAKYPGMPKPMRLVDIHKHEMPEGGPEFIWEDGFQAGLRAADAMRRLEMIVKYESMFKEMKDAGIVCEDFEFDAYLAQAPGPSGSESKASSTDEDQRS